MDPLGDQLKDILLTALEGVKVSDADRANLTKYALEVAKCAVRAKGGESAALSEMQGYMDAISLVVARYEVKTVDAAEKAAFRVMGMVTKLAISALA